MRDKLISLLEDVGATCDVPCRVDEDGCGTYEIMGADYIADHLIANGVTFATDNNVGSKWIPVIEPPQKNGCYFVLTQLHLDSTQYARVPVPAIWCEETWSISGITHWMPLPEPPEGVNVNA